MIPAFGVGACGQSEGRRCSDCCGSLTRGSGRELDSAVKEVALWKPLLPRNQVNYTEVSNGLF